MPPLLLLDVDGVLSPTGRSVPPGFRRHTSAAYDVVLSDSHGAWLRTLALDFEIVWATTWGESANDVIGDLLELPRFDVLPMGSLPRDGTRKLPAVREFVGDRPVAWVDDELYDDAVAWSRARTAPTLVLRPAGSVGLTRSDVEALRSFAGSLTD